MIQSLDKGLRLLFILSERKSMGVTELAKVLQVNKSTSFRLLETLETHDLVEQDEVTGKYRLGLGVLRLSEKLVNSFDIISIAKPFLHRLVETTQESAHLCVFSSGRAFIADQAISSETIKVTAKIGKVEPLHCSAVGKCLLAFRSEKEKNRLLDSMEWTAYTPGTITDRSMLEDQLVKIRENGFATDEEELTPGVICIAAPIFNHKGEVVYCLGISGPAARINTGNRDDYTGKVRKAAELISAKLGYSS